MFLLSIIVITFLFTSVCQACQEGTERKVTIEEKPHIQINWFLCLNGTEIVTACERKGNRIELGEKYETKHYVYQCTKITGARAVLKIIGCLNSTEDVPVEELLHVEILYAKVVCRDGKNKVEIVGCIDQNGELVEDGATVRQKGFLLKCMAGPEGGIFVEGCVWENMDIPVGKFGQTETLLAQCVNYGDGVEIQLVACIDEYGVVRHLGERFTNDDLIYQECRNTTGNTLDIVMVGCVTDDGMVKNGDYYTDTAKCKCVVNENGQNGLIQVGEQESI